MDFIYSIIKQENKVYGLFNEISVAFQIIFKQKKELFSEL